MTYNQPVTTQAAKGRTLFSLAAVCIAAAALLAPSPASATKTAPSLLAPSLAAPAAPAQPAGAAGELPPTLPLYTTVDVVTLGGASSLEADQVEAVVARQRYRLHLLSSYLARSDGLESAPKTATGVSSSLGADKHLKRRDLRPKLHRPSYQGLWTDPTTGLSYARNRWYDARTASWLSEDPLGPVDSPNLYAFVGWGPHVGTDPMGLEQIPDAVVEAWKAGHPGYRPEQLLAWMDAWHAANDAREANDGGWFDSLRGWYYEHIRAGEVSEAVDEFAGAYRDAEDLNRSSADYTEANVRRQSEGRKTGLGQVAQSSERVVIAGVTTVVIVADDISVLAGATGLAKYGLREGMQVLIRRSDGTEELLEIVGEKLVKKKLPSTRSEARRLGRNLEQNIGPRPLGAQDAHIVPTGGFVNRSAAVQDAIRAAQSKFDQYLGPELRSTYINGFWSDAGHLGTHKDAFFLALGEAVESVNSGAQMEAVMKSLLARVKSGEFL